MPVRFRASNTDRGNGWHWRGASNGILIKGADGLERAAKVNKVFFDKTGTLTQGKPKVLELRVFGSTYSQQQVAEIVAVAEKDSEHRLHSS